MAPPNAIKLLEGLDVSDQNKVACVVGGTTGIGAAIARQLAQVGCSEVFIFGRNEERANGVIADMRKVAKNPNSQFSFVKGDLSCVRRILHTLVHVM